MRLCFHPRGHPGCGPPHPIYVHPGEYTERLLIDKSLQLLATQQGQAVLKSPGFLKNGSDGPVAALVAAPSRKMIQVLINGFTVQGGIDLQGDEQSSLIFNLSRSTLYGFIICLAEGRVDRVLDETLLYITVKNSKFLAFNKENSAINGIQIANCAFQRVKAFIQRSTFTGGFTGINLELGPGPMGGPLGQDAFILLEDNLFSANWGYGVGIEVIEKVQVILRDNVFLDNYVGARLDAVGRVDYEGEEPQVHRPSILLEGNRFLGNQYGLDLAGIAKEYGLIEIRGSEIRGSARVGLYVRTDARMRVHDNVIEDNEWGVYVLRAPHTLIFSNNTVRYNREWGFALDRRPCVEDPLPTEESPIPFFIFIQGEGNEIYDNGRGDLCPSDYSWPEGFVKPPETP